MSTFFIALHVAISILLIICILVQHRVSGLSATFGGGGSLYVQRRGAEKVLFKLTIIFSVLFFALSIVQLIVKGY